MSAVVSNTRPPLVTGSKTYHQITEDICITTEQLPNAPRNFSTNTFKGPSLSQVLRLQAERDSALADLEEARQDIKLMRANIKKARENLNFGMEKMEAEARLYEKAISDSEKRTHAFEKKFKEASEELVQTQRECDRKQCEIIKLKLLLVESEKSYGEVKGKIVEILSAIQ